MEDEIDRAVNIVEEVRSWVHSDPMNALLDLFHRDDDLAADGDAAWLHLNEQLPEWLLPLLEDGFASAPTRSESSLRLLSQVIDMERRAADSFNFRSRDGQTYRERSEALTADFTSATRTKILELATRLGLVNPAVPRYDSYDMTLVLGGGFRSPLLRTRYAALLERQGVELGELYLLGSPRFLITGEPPEQPVTSLYAPEATDEFGLLLAAVVGEFGLSPGPIIFLCGCSAASSICPRWQFEGDNDRTNGVPPEYTHERSAALLSTADRSRGSVISASTSRPPYRPDTSDTFALWARYADPAQGRRILIVTTQVFVPFQRFDGLRRLYLHRGLEIDAVGFGADWGDRPQTAEYLLQETLSAIRSARRLLVDAVEILIG